MTLTENPETESEGASGADTERDATAVLIGETAATLLPADEAWSAHPLTGDVTLPIGKAVAVGAQVGDHVVSFLVSASMERRIKVGPPPADGLLDGMAHALEAVAEVLGIGAADALVEMNPQAVVAETPDHAFVVALHDGEDHLVTVVVTPPTPVAAADEPDAVDFQPITSASTGAGVASGLEVLHDVEMGVTVELGRTRMLLRDILGVVPGSVIELDRAASAPVDVLVNGTLIARGEVVVIDEEFGIRITEVVGHHDDPSAS